MTWFQLAAQDASEEPARRPRTERLVPNSAFFLNPALLAQSMAESAPTEPERPHLRLVR